MDAVKTEEGTELGNAELEKLEAALLPQEQIDCPVVHKFADGLYIREVTMPAGILAIGHAHKIPCWNEMAVGKIAVPDNGKVSVMSAPISFTGEAGSRKIGVVIETVVWRNIWPNPDNERDIDKLEARYIDKSDAWKDNDKSESSVSSAFIENDRKDFHAVLEEYGFSAEEVRQQSEDESDQIEMPVEWSIYTAVRKSEIEGRGLFLSWPLNKGDIVAPARIGGKRTPAGRYVNHSKMPNCVFVKNDDGEIHLVAARDISGCKGGDKGEELTVDYRQALELNGVKPKEAKCQR